MSRAAAAGRCLTYREIAAAAGITAAKANKYLSYAYCRGIIKRVNGRYMPPWQMSEETTARHGAGNFELGPVLPSRHDYKKLLARARAMRYAGASVKEVAVALGVSRGWVTHNAPKRRQVKRDKLHLRSMSRPGY